MAQIQPMSRKKARAPWQEDALNAIACLKNGGVLLHATDTVWGLAADATHAGAVEKIYRIKDRVLDQPLLMLASNDRMVEMLQPQLPDEAWELMEVSDRPVTVVAPFASACRYAIHPFLVNAAGACAVRLIQDAYCQFIIDGLGKPIASTSANKSGESSPAVFTQIANSIKKEVDFIGLHGQQNKAPSAPSMLVEFDESNRFRIIRP